MKTRSTKSALISSALALLLCVSMLLGTTYAWFTDSVTSENNIIKSGNLDIELDYLDANGEWKTVENSSTILDPNALWEPGYTQVVYLRMRNAGSLALKYQFGIQINEEKPGMNSEGEFMLSDYIYFGVDKNVTADADGKVNEYADRAAAQAAVATDAKQIKNGFSDFGTLLKDSGYQYMALVVYMPTFVGNLANYVGVAPEINLGISVFATQDVEEEDSFDKYYDAGTPWLGGTDIDWYLDNPDATEFTIHTSEELAGLAAIVNGTATSPVATFSTEATEIHDDFEGKTVKLAADLNLDGNTWTPIGRIGTTSTDFTYSFKGTFDGQNHTISNFDVNAYGWAGVFGLAHGAQINNLKVENVSIRANRMAGAIVGQLYGSIDNCHVANADIVAVPNAVGDSFDNGDKVGGIVGWIGDNGNNHTLTDCSADDVELGAYRDVGGIAGYVAWSTTVSGNKVDNIKITVDQDSHFYGDKDPNAGAVYGRTSGDITDENNTVGANIVIAATVNKGGITYKIDGVTGAQILHLVPASYEKDTVTVAEGTTAIGNYAFANNSNVKTVILASTVKDLGRGFDSNTSIKKVVLNEGLEVISSRAFKATTALEEVVFSSTVTKIEDNAFQKSGIKEIVIPASVTTIGDSCFTAATVESVVIEGANVEIAHYAFRDCPNLTKVTILSDSVTLGDGMIFTNSQNNNQNPNNITIYVRNEAVKSAIEENGTFNGTIVVMKDTEVSEDGTIPAETWTEGADTVYLPAGEYTFSATDMGAGDTLICAPGTVFEGNSKLNIDGATVIGATFSNPTGTAADQTINGTFKDCTFTGVNGLRWCYAGETVVFENCVFDGSTYGVHFDGGANEAYFKNCTFSGFNAMGGAITKLTMEGCTFKPGRSGYNGINLWGSTDMINCTFIFDGTKTEWVDACGDDKSYTFTNCVVTDGTNVTDIKTVIGDYGEGNTITVDEEPLAFNNAQLSAAVAAGETKVYLRNGEYDLKGNQKDGLTLIGLGDDVKVANTTQYASGKSTGAIWQKINLENVTITNTVYTMADGGKSTFTNVNFAAGFRQGYGTGVVFTNCTFGSNSEGYALHFQTDSASEGGMITLNGCEFEGGKVHLGGKRAYTFKGCDFAAGTDFQVWSNITLEDCTVDGAVVNADNVATLFPNLNLEKVTVVIDGAAQKKADTQDSFSSAMSSQGNVDITLGDGEYKMPSSNTSAEINISGTKDTVIDMTMGAYMDSANVTITGVTIKTSTGKANGNGSDYAALYTPNVTYVDCTFVGPMRVGRDGAKFVNCTFTELGNDYVWTYGNDVTFEGCTFNTDGKAILIYSDGGNEVSQVTIKNCTFTSTQGAKAGAIANQNCAAIEIHNYGNGVNLVTEGNEYDANFSGEWRIKTYENGKPKVIVNGTEYTTIAIDGKLMTIDANKNVTIAD